MAILKLPKSRGVAFLGGNSHKLSPGLYPNLIDLGRVFDESGGIEWTVNNRACSSTVNGWIAVDNVVYEGDVLKTVDLRFYQDCYGHLYGKVHWNNSFPVSFSGPLNPIPENTWKPDSSEVPTTGNYLYFNSQLGSYIGGGKSGLITEEHSEILVEQIDGEIYVDIYPQGGLSWSVRFSSMEGFDEKPQGHYSEITSRYNPARGKFEFTGDGRFCNSHSWVAIDKISYLEGKIVALDLRFKQRCEFYIPGVYGAFHWEAP